VCILSACCARAASGYAATAPPSAASNSRRPMATVIRPSRARCVGHGSTPRACSLDVQGGQDAGRFDLCRGHRLQKQRRRSWRTVEVRACIHKSRLFGTTTDVHPPPTSGAEADAPGLRIWAASRHANRRSDARRARIGSSPLMASHRPGPSARSRLNAALTSARCVKA